jgi:hypothetical protein
MNPVLDAFVGEWQINGITTFQSGNPLNPTPAQDRTNTGQFNWTQRPNIVSPIQYMDPRATGYWFNPNSLVNPPLGTLGNAARGVLIGPGINNWDLGITKNFPVKERARVQFRCEMFNAFNHTQFSGAYTTIDPSVSTLTGRITSARAPRNIQMALRFEY